MYICSAENINSYLPLHETKIYSQEIKTKYTYAIEISRTIVIDKFNRDKYRRIDIKTYFLQLECQYLNLII